ncbi:MAG: hypothetical protein U1A27_08990 [Phycisphaerae bacterium]
MSTTVTRTDAIEALNAALAAVCHSTLPHLATAEAFVSWLSVEEQALLGAMVRDEESQRRELAAAILELGGEPRATPPATSAAELHYLDLRYVVPRLVADKRRLAAELERVASRTADEPRAAAALGRVLQSQREQAAHLSRMAASRGLAT